MKGITAEEQELIDELFKPMSLLDMFRAKEMNERKGAILQTLGNRGGIATLPFLLSAAIQFDSMTAVASREAVHKMIKRHGCKGMIQAEQYIRQLTPYGSDKRLLAWHDVQPSSISGKNMSTAVDVSMIGAYSFHRNGFVREVAVERLAQSTTGSEIPFLLIRLNDWVPQIRFLAFRALKQRIKAEYLKDFLEAVYLINHVSEYYRREKFEDLVNEIYGLFRQMENRDVFLEGLHSREMYARRFCFRFALSLPDLDRETVFAKALVQSDAVIRLTVVKQLYLTSSDQELNHWVGRFWNDSFVTIRRIALQAYVERLPELAEQALRTALLDPHKSIREMARFYAKSEQIYFPAFYREKLAEGEEHVLQGAIGGLGETGDKADARLLVPFLSHERLRIRRAAVKAVGILDPEGYFEELLHSLQSETCGLSRDTSRMLAEVIDARHAKRLWEVYSEDSPKHVRINLLYLFSRLGNADKLLYFLQACMVEDQEVREFAIEYVIGWAWGANTRFYVSLTDEKRQSLKDALEKAKELLPNQVVTQLAGYL